MEKKRVWRTDELKDRIIEVEKKVWLKDEEKDTRVLSARITDTNEDGTFNIEIDYISWLIETQKYKVKLTYNRGKKPKIDVQMFPDAFQSKEEIQKIADERADYMETIFTKTNNLENFNGIMKVNDRRINIDGILGVNVSPFGPIITVSENPFMCKQIQGNLNLHLDVTDDLREKKIWTENTDIIRKNNLFRINMKSEKVIKNSDGWNIKIVGSGNFNGETGSGREKIKWNWSGEKKCDSSKGGSSLKLIEKLSGKDESVDKKLEYSSIWELTVAPSK